MRKLAYFYYDVMIFAITNSAYADESAPKIYFKEKGDTILVIERILKRLDREPNQCDGSSCEKLYALEYVGTDSPPSSIPAVTKGEVSASDSHTLILTLDKAPESLDSLRLVLKRLKTSGADKPIRMELMVEPTAFLEPDSRSGVVYRAIRLHHQQSATPSGDDEDVLKPENIKITVSAKNEDTGEVQSFDDRIKILSVKRYGQGEAPAEGDVLWLIRFKPSLPRGTTATVSVTGIDTFDQKPLTGRGAGKVEAYPKGRDDAEYYLNGQYIFNQTEKDQGSIDFKVEKHFFIPASALDWWYKVEGTVGSKSLDISQSGTAAAGRTWWWLTTTKTEDDTSWGLSLAPTFRTDRDFKNRDLGADLTLKTTFGSLYQTLEIKRKTAPSTLFGWSLVPQISIESGQHLASSSSEVDGKNFVRGLGNINLMFERADVLLPFATLRLTVDGTARYLFQDEVLLDSGNVVKTDKGYVSYLRAELAYDLGPVAISAVHENGRKPPDFKRAHATTVGVTVKF